MDSFSGPLVLLVVGYALNSTYNAGICAAAANVSAHAFPNFVRREIRRTRGIELSRNKAHVATLMLIEQCYGRANLAGSAISALKAIMLKESCLYRMKVVSLCESFSRSDLVTFVNNCE
jgi:hypothetical protein